MFRKGDELIFQETDSKAHRVTFVRFAEYVKGCSVVKPLSPGWPDEFYVQTSKLRRDGRTSG